MFPKIVGPITHKKRNRRSSTTMPRTTRTWRVLVKRHVGTVIPQLTPYLLVRANANDIIILYNNSNTMETSSACRFFFGYWRRALARLEANDRIQVGRDSVSMVWEAVNGKK